MKTKLMMTTALALALTVTMANAQTASGTATPSNQNQSSPPPATQKDNSATPQATQNSGASSTNAGTNASPNTAGANNSSNTNNNNSATNSSSTGSNASNSNSNTTSSGSNDASRTTNSPASAQSTQPSNNQPAAQNNNTQQPSNATAQQPSAPQQNNTAQTPNNNNNRAATANNNDSNARTQISASLRVEQRTELNRAVASIDARPLQNVNFSVSVGTTVPRTVTLQPVPTAIVSIIPQYRGYSYFVVRDEVVIVEPGTSRIVDVITKTGGPSQARTTTTERSKVNLSGTQRNYLRQHTSKREVTTSGSSPRASSRTIVVGEKIPETVEIMSFPAEVYQEVPAVRSYRYVHGDRGVYLVDPDSRTVIEELDD